MNQVLNNIHKLLWITLFPLMLITSFFATWCFWSSQDFLYSFWYDHTELEEFIDFYAPQNKFEPQFSDTTREERIRLFSEIVKSINSKGRGLEDIQYYSATGEILGKLLHKNEILHLKEVSSLVSYFKSFSWFSLFLLFSFLIFIFLKKNKESISFKKISLYYIFIFIFFFVVVFLSGPLKVFEVLHELVFPDGHQWFFYYQDSLMTTLMMAPKLFMYISILWISSSLFLFFIIIYSVRKITKE